jgi:hypothetical protein
MHNEEHGGDVMVIRFRGFDSCIIGGCQTWDDGELVERVIYDSEKMIALLMGTGVTYDEAVKNLKQNVITVYRGPTSPIVMVRADFALGAH